MKLSQMFASADDLNEAHKMLAYVQYRFLNKQNASQFVCINLLDYYLGNEPKIPYGEVNFHLRTIGMTIERRIKDYLRGEDTVEARLAFVKGLGSPADVDFEEAREYRLTMIENLLKELA